MESRLWQKMSQLRQIIPVTKSPPLAKAQERTGKRRGGRGGHMNFKIKNFEFQERIYDLEVTANYELPDPNVGLSENWEFYVTAVRKDGGEWAVPDYETAEALELAVESWFWNLNQHQADDLFENREVTL